MKTSINSIKETNKVAGITKSIAEAWDCECRNTIKNHTPWGPAQTVCIVAPGIASISTSSHGGLFVVPALNSKIPKAIRQADGWYEEDCDWAIPYYFLKNHITSTTADNHPQNERNTAAIQLAEATLKNWHASAFEKVTGIKVKPEESQQIREQIFHEKNRGKLIVTAAWGDWQDGVSKGMVGVCAKEDAGYYPESDKKEHWFIVDADEYKGSKPFVIDPAKHKEVARFIP